MIYVEVGAEHDRDLMLRKLIESQYVRNDTMLGRGRFRVKGDVVEVRARTTRRLRTASPSSATKWRG